MEIERCAVLIVGGGPAGLAAALELKRQGIHDVRVLDREEEAGGVPRMCHHTGFGLRDLRRVQTGPAYTSEYRKRVADAGIPIATSAMATDWSGPRAVCVTSPRGVQQIEAQALLLATGCRERPQAARLVPGHRATGVFTTGSLQRFVYGYGQPVGKRAVVVGAELVSLSSVLTLLHAGLTVARVVTEHPHHQVYLPYLPVLWYLRRRHRISITAQARVTRTLGARRIEGVELTHTATGEVEIVPCDTVVFTGNWIPEHDLARLGGLAIHRGTQGPQVDPALRTSAEGVFAAGNLLRGAETADLAALEGRHAAAGIARYLQGEPWPVVGVPIHAESPVTWIAPNVAGPGGEPPPNGTFRFQVDTFCRQTRLGLYQGKRLLHAQTYRQLRPNHIHALGANWLAQVEPLGEPVRVTLA